MARVGITDFRASGIWGGLLSLPELDGHRAAEDAIGDDDLTPSLHRAVSRFGELESHERLLPVSHGFTHYKLLIAPYRVTLARRLDAAAEAGHVWLDTAAIGAAALPAPVKKLLLDLFGAGDAAQARMF